MQIYSGMKKNKTNKKTFEIKSNMYLNITKENYNTENKHFKR